MFMGMVASQSMVTRQTQKIEQMLKLTLRHELKQILRQILKMLQAMKQTQKIELEQLQEIYQAVQELQERDTLDLVHESIRRGGLHWAYDLGYVLYAISQYDTKFARLEHFAAVLQQKVVEEEQRRAVSRKRRSNGPQLLMLMVMRGPDPCGGSAGDLAKLLRSVPQMNERSQVDWVLAGGWAVQILVGKEFRNQHDIDVLVGHEKFLRMDSDAKLPDDREGCLNCTPAFIGQHCLWNTSWQHDQEQIKVIVLCPEYMFLSKFLRSPRPQDWEDVQELVRCHIKTFDLGLMRKIIRRNSCGFTRTRELMKILETRNMEGILSSLATFWQQ